MGLFDFIRPKKAPEPGPTMKGLVGSSPGTVSPWFRGSGSILGLINSCYPDAQPTVSPRAVLDEIRATNWAFTPFTEAATKHAEIMGRVVIKSEDPKLEQELQDMADNISVVLNNRKDSKQAHKGLDVACFNILKWSKLEGESFAEQTESEDGTINRIRIYDSTRFDIQRIMQFDDRLTFIQDSGAMIYVPETMNLVEFAPNMQPGLPWGIPMAYNATFISTRLTNLIVNQGTQRARVSNPPGFAYLGIDPTMVKSMPVHEHKTLMDAINTVGETMRELFTRSMATDTSQAHRNFASGTLPAGVSVLEKTFGADIPIMGEFADEFDRFARMAFLPCGLPYPFIGLEGPSGGMNADLFDKLMQLVQVAADQHRHDIRPVALRFMHQLMDSMKMRPGLKDRFTIEFDAPNLGDMLRNATIKQTEQEAFAAGINNYLTLREMPGLSEQEARQRAEDYARESGLQFLTSE